MKKLGFAALLLFLGTSVLSAYEVSNVALQWSAFKTPQKVAVSGTFKDMKLKSHKTQSLPSALLGTSLIIDTKSVASGNAGRDVTLVKSYFDVFTAPKIKATIVKYSETNIVLSIAMNGKTHNVIMDYKFLDEKRMELEGTMNMMDFGLGKALKSISEACFDLHQGKTWSDVKLKVIFNIDR